MRIEPMCPVCGESVADYKGPCPKLTGSAISLLSESEQRRRVVEEARTWIKTPYHHAADLKGVGVDCAMLLVRVYADLGLIDPFDPRPYPADWHLHRSEERYLKFLLARSHQVEEPQPGDVFLLRYGRAYSHGGIVTRVKPLWAIHAYMPHGIVVEEEIWRCPSLAKRLRDAIFSSYWG